MARFYASISGSAQTEATRTGAPKSGIAGHIRGWNVGVMVVGQAKGDEDVFTVYLTGGSNDRRGATCVGVVQLDETGAPVFTAIADGA